MAEQRDQLIRHDRWMAKALYGPQGYYTSKKTVLGARGDFSTTPKLSSTLAWTLAERVAASGLRDIIELGPGDGTLATDLFQNLSWWRKKRTRYHFVEISPRLQELQRARFPAKKAFWHAELSDALRATSGTAFILSNEFFDAFPVRVFRDQTELFLRDGSEEVWKPTNDQCRPISSAFSHQWPGHQRLEVAESIQEWCQSQLQSFHKGEMISVDYGGSAKEIYHRRPEGSIRAYWHHQRQIAPEIYDYPGQKDLTFDVNFEDLRTWTEAAGLTTAAYQTQAKFCDDLPGGPSDHFQVLHQSRG